jgi:hypothetical protein
MLYAMMACLMRCMSEDQEGEEWSKTFSDAFFCLKWVKFPAKKVMAP